MTQLYIAGTFLGILLVLLIGMWINGRRKRHSSMIRAGHPTVGDDEETGSRYATIIASPVTWAIGFLAVVGLVLGATFAVLSDMVALDIATWDLALGLFGVLFLGFLSFNIFLLARNRGHSSALSIAETVAFVALITVAGVAAMLIGA